MSKLRSNTRIVLGTVAAMLIALEPLMMLWQPILPPGSYAAIATVVAVIRAGVTYYMSSDMEVKKLNDDES